MDPFTHALSGALVNRVIAPASTAAPRFSLGERTWLGAGAALFPDIDWLLLPLTDSLSYLNLHRGETHSLIMLPFWALLLGWLLARFWPGQRDWRDAAMIVGLGIGIHILGDFITNYGTQLFAPLSREPLAFASTFILDPWITLILVIGLGMTLLRGGRRWAAVGILGAAAIVLAQSALKLNALEHARAEADRRGLHGARIHALPQPVNPLHWRLFIEAPDAQLSAHLGFLSPVGTAGPEDGLLVRHWRSFQPPGELRWRSYPRFGEAELAGFAEEAWSRPEFAGFRRFAMLPHLREVTTRNGDRCAVFADLRFRVESVPAPFQYAMCRTPEGDWRLNDVSLWEALDDALEDVR